MSFFKISRFCTWRFEGEGKIFKNALSNKYSTGIKHHRFGKTLLLNIWQLCTMKSWDIGWTYFQAASCCYQKNKYSFTKGTYVQQRSSQNHILVTIIQVAILRNRENDKLSDNFHYYYLLYNILHVSYIHLLVCNANPYDTSFD